jgi:lysophospholipase L1-like esterase
MRFKVSAILLALAVAGALAGSAQNTGSANFTTYVALGDSLTAGFCSGSLNQACQANSYPALIYKQATGKTSGFEQPRVTDPGIPAILRLASLSPLQIVSKPGLGQPANLNLPRPYNNLAVPGANVADVRNRVTDGGGLHDLILRGLGTQLQQALVQHPTFVTLWIGNNDALAAATRGIVVDDLTLTTTARFEADYRAIVTAIAASGAKLAIANVPQVTAIPFVTTLPPVLVNPATRQPVIINGAPVRLIGPNGLLRPTDFVLLSAQAELAVGKGIPRAAGGTDQPLSDAVVLSAEEAATINARVNSYNAVIRAVANEVGAAFVDANAALEQVRLGRIGVGGATYSGAFLTGGVFSYDGVHPTPFGYAYVANLFIQAINDKFGGDIEPVNLYPFVFGPDASAGAATSSVAFDGIYSPNTLSSFFWALRIPEDPKPLAPTTRRPRGRRG